MFEESLRAALQPGKDCPTVEDLGNYLDQRGDQTWRTFLQSHLTSCAHCRTELRLLEEFQSAEVNPEDAAAVRAVTEQLGKRAGEIFGARPRKRWWQELLGARWLSPAAVALAGVLLVAGVSLQIRRSGAPSLHPSGNGGTEVLRSSTLTVVAPVGDLSKAPAEIQWQPAAGAAKYRVQLLEVDRTQFWQAETAASRIELPAGIRERMVPGKTILCEVVALDNGGAKVADSEMVRFRVAPNIH